MFSLDVHGLFDGKSMTDVIRPLLAPELPLDLRRPQALQGIAPGPAALRPVPEEGFSLVEAAAL